jgi:ABC-type molybdate transport system ATPase subunit
MRDVSVRGTLLAVGHGRERPAVPCRLQRVSCARRTHVRLVGCTNPRRTQLDVKGVTSSEAERSTPCLDIEAKRFGAFFQHARRAKEISMHAHASCNFVGLKCLGALLAETDRRGRILGWLCLGHILERIRARAGGPRQSA